MKKIVMFMLCIALTLQNSSAVYAAETERVLEQSQEHIGMESDALIPEEPAGDSEAVWEEEVLEDNGAVQEEEVLEDNGAVQEEEVIEENEAVQEEEVLEDNGAVQEEEVIEENEAVPEEEVLEDSEPIQEEVLEDEAPILTDEDPQYGRENGYLDENFWGTVLYSEDATEYIHNSKFEGYTIYDVIDVSKYQGDIDWAKVKQSGIDYAIIRAGFRGYGEEGTLNTDTHFQVNIEQAISAGLEVGVYFFSQAITEAEAIEEAEYVLNLISGYDVSLPVAIDFEYASSSAGLIGRLYNANLSKEEATKICKQFCVTVENSGYTAMVYANKDMLENELNALEISEEYKVWLANYTTSTSYAGDYDFWQYTQNGTVDGIVERVDKSFWYKKQDTSSAESNIYNGVDYSLVYDFSYYTEKYSDIKNAFGNDEEAALEHFVNYGMSEGRQGCEDFNVHAYKNRYGDLTAAFGNDYNNYYMHYINYGKEEGRSGLDRSEEIDFSLVYDFEFYISNNEDIRNVFGNDEEAVLEHFINYGMSEGRQGCETFNVHVYKCLYEDLATAFGENLKEYYMHYINYGKEEGRKGNDIAEEAGPVTEYEGIDYALVYDFSYYLDKNEDVRSVLGNDKKAVLKHFVEYGMSEGRRACENFDVHTYRNHYSDLKGVFGEDLKAYYLHYIEYGKNECRTARYIGQMISCQIIDGSKEEMTIEIKINLEEIASEYKEIYIAQTDLYKDAVPEKIWATKDGISETGMMQAVISGKEQIKAALMDGFAVAVKDEDGNFILRSKSVGISNPEAIASNTDVIFKGTSKKGLQGIYYANYEGGDDILDARNANTKQTLINLDLATVVSTTPKSGYTEYKYRGNTYYFSELTDLKANIQSLNYGYKQYLYGNSDTTSVAVTLCLLLSYNSENSFLIDPAARTQGHSYYMLNVREEEARETLEALFLYLGEIFGQSNCYVSNWVLGNEINSSKAWNYSGSLDFDTYLECYATAFRLLYNGVKSEKTGNTVCISLDNGWMAVPDTYAGKTTLDTFAQKIYAVNPNIEWSIAYHAYSYPLTKADFWNDYSNTTDSLSTKYISMRNINVLTDYVGALESNYGRSAGSIRVLLTEQGYSYGAGAELQAMAIARGYYIAQFNERIDAFIIRAVVDDANEASGKLYFGLMNNRHEKRIAFYVYEYMDSDLSQFSNTPASGTVSSENYNKFNKAKQIVCNTNWKSIIEGFDASKLADIK